MKNIFKNILPAIIVGVLITSFGVLAQMILAPFQGGTGLGTYSRGDLIAATSSSALVRVATGTDAYVLTMSSGFPTWAVAAAAGLWSTSTGFTYLTATSSDLVVGLNVTSSAPFWMDVSTGDLTITGNLSSADSFLTSESDPIWIASSSDYVAWADASTTNWENTYLWKSSAIDGSDRLKMAYGGLEADLSAITTGGLISGNGAGSVGITNLGTDGYYLMASSSAAGGIEWTEVTDTTYSATGTLLDLTSEVFSVNAGDLTNTKGCKYVSGTGLVCDQDYLTTESDPIWVASSTNYYTSAEVDAFGFVTSTLTEEEVEDFVGGMLGGTETLITVTYQDASNDIDFVVDNDLHNYSWANVVDADITNTLTVTGYMQDEDINTFAELQSWVTDATLVKVGTTTDTKVCVWDNAGSQIVCETTAGAGTVTSVAMSVPTGLAISGSPITTSGTLALTYDTGYSAVLDASTTNWETAYGWGDWGGNIDISTDTNLTAGRSLTLTGDDVLADAELFTKMITFSIKNATTTRNPAGCHKFATAVTITRVSCAINNTTSSIQLDERAEATPFTSGTDVLSAALTCTTSTASTTAFANAGIAVDVPFCLDIDVMNGNSTTTMFVHVDYTKDD